MPRGARDGILIAGGGIAGGLAALAMARLRPDVPLLIVEEAERFGGGRSRLFFADALGDAEKSLAGIVADRGWPGFYLAFPDVARKLRAGIGWLDGDALHRVMTETLRPDQYRLGARVVAVREDALVLDGGETIKAEGAIDARGPASQSMLESLYEARVERLCRLAAPHGLDRPVLIDATAGGSGGSHVELVPLAADRLILADVALSDRAQSDAEAAARLESYLARRGWRAAEVEAERLVSRPLPYGGDLAAFWRIGGARAARLGLRGGFVDPLTGDAVADALANAALLAGQRDFSGAALHDLYESRARQLWRRRESRREWAATLAATPAAERNALLARLHALDPGLVVRLRADRLGLGDRLRVQRALRRG